MKHFPAHAFRVTRFPIQGVSRTLVPRVVPLKTTLLLAATAFVTGFTAAVYTIGFIVTAR